MSPDVASDPDSWPQGLIEALPLGVLVLTADRTAPVRANLRARTLLDSLEPHTVLAAPSFWSGPAPHPFEWAWSVSGRSRETWRFQAPSGLRLLDMVAAPCLLPSHTDARTLLVDPASNHQETSELNRLAFEANPLPIYVYDEDSLCILTANQATAEAYGYSVEQLTGMPVTQLAEENARPLLKSTALAGRRGPRRSGLWKHVTRDGAHLTLQGWSLPVTCQGRPARLIVCLDLTRQLALEQQLRQAQRLEALGQLAGGVAHDFNNLLTVINGYASLALRNPALPAALHSALQSIAQAGSHAAQLTQQLLAFSRKQVLSPELIDVHQSLLRSEPALRRLLPSDVTLALDLAAEPPRLLADPAQFDLMVANVVLNARDSMLDGGRLVIQTCLEPSSTASDPAPAYLRLTISDTGAGMDERTKARIFDPFFTSRSDSSKGLGLSTVYGFAQQCGGRVEVDSTLGQGTSVSIFLPLAPHPSPAPGIASPGRQFILVVEDDAEVRAYAVAVLNSLGFSTLEAASTPEALSLARAHGSALSLVIADLRLPGAGGLALAAQLANDLPHLKVILCSGFSDQDPLTLGGAPAGSVFLAKPYSPEELARTVRHALGQPETVLLAGNVPDSLLRSRGCLLLRLPGAAEAIEWAQKAPVAAIVLDHRLGMAALRMVAASLPATRLILYGHSGPKPAGASESAASETALARLLGF